MKLISLIFLFLISTSASAINVSVENTTDKAITLQLQPGARINDALQNQAINETSFFLGAGWYRKKLVKQQAHLRAGILFELQLLANIQTLNGNTEATEQAKQLYQLINTLQANGRSIHILEPAAVLATAINHLLEDGDSIIFRKRPSKVAIIGAINNTCLLTFKPIQTANDYLQLCPISKTSNPNFVYIIQANGDIYQQGIAPYNQRIKQFIAPGAIIFLPFNTDIINNINTNINNDIIQFLATQTPLKETYP